MRFVGAVLLVLLAGCAAETGDGDEGAASSNDAIIGGKRTFQEPEVGVSTLNGATGCSGSLVRPNVVLLAGHCFPPDRSDIAPWRFQIRKSATESYDFDTGPGWVKGRNTGADDFGLISLVQQPRAARASGGREASFDRQELAVVGDEAADLRFRLRRA